MAKTIAKLNIHLGATTAALQKGFDDAQKKIAGFGAKVKQAGIVAAKAAAVMGAAAVGAGVAIARWVAPQFEIIDALAKSADKLGINITALQGLQHAADLAGVSSEQLEGGLAKFLNKLSEAATGNEAAIKTFEELGLTVADFTGLPLEEQIGLVADGLNDLGSQAARVRVSMDLFGKTGADLLNVLDSDVLRQSAEDAKALGLELTRVDAARVEAANDAWTRMQAALTAVAQKIAVEVAPTVTALIEQLIDAGKQGDGLGAAIIRGSKAGSIAIGALVDSARALSASFLLVQKGWEGIFSLPLLLIDDEAARLWLRDVDRLKADLADAVDGGFTQRLLDGIDRAKAAAVEVGDAVGDRLKENLTAPLATAARLSESLTRRVAGVGAVTAGSTAAFSAEQEGRRELSRMAALLQAIAANGRSQLDVQKQIAARGGVQLVAAGL